MGEASGQSESVFICAFQDFLLDILWNIPCGAAHSESSCVRSAGRTPNRDLAISPLS